MKDNLSIFKIGGNIIEDDAQLQHFLSAFAKAEGFKILVHGGGKKASQLLTKMSITPKMVNGRRITDAATLEVAVMVYAGLINKNIVAKLQGLGVNAIGMSGADANSIQAVKRPVEKIDYGFVGDIMGVDGQMVGNILQLGLTPVFCALTHDQKGQLLNTNADTIASEMAIALGNRFKVVLNYCFELNGVLNEFDDKNSVIPRINSEAYEQLVKNNIITDGMLPKMHNCFHALQNGAAEVRIGNLGLFDNEKNNYTSLVL